jgi:hypothetical protein
MEQKLQGIDTPDFQTRPFNFDENGYHVNKYCLYFSGNGKCKTARVYCRKRGHIPYEWCTTSCTSKFVVK